MGKNISFQLDTEAAAEIIGSMAMPLIKKSGQAVQQRAQSMASSISSNPPSITLKTEIGRIKRGKRAIATIQANYNNKRESYIAHSALAKSKDAGRVN